MPYHQIVPSPSSALIIFAVLLFTNFQIFSTYIYCILDSFSSTMDSGSYVMDSATLLAPPPRFPFTMTTSRHSLPNLDPNDMVVSQVSTYFILYLHYLGIYICSCFTMPSKNSQYVQNIHFKSDEENQAKLRHRL